MEVLPTNVCLCLKISFLFKVRTNVSFCLCFSCCLSLFVYSEEKFFKVVRTNVCLIFVFVFKIVRTNVWESQGLWKSERHRQQRPPSRESVKKPATSRPRCSFKDRLTQCLQQIGLLRFFKSRATEKPWNWRVLSMAEKLRRRLKIQQLIPCGLIAKSSVPVLFK